MKHTCNNQNSTQNSASAPHAHESGASQGASAGAGREQSKFARATHHTPDPRKRSVNPLRRKNNLDLNIPKNTDARITREHALHNTIFTRTRILVLALALVAALSITGTLAYLTWTSNQTANRATTGTINLKIGERGSTTTEYTYNTDGSYSKGDGNKNMLVEIDNTPSAQKSYVTVSLVPLVASKSFSNPSSASQEGYASFAQDWSNLQTEEKGGKTRYYISTGVVKVYLTDGWNTAGGTQNGVWQWSSVDGTFSYSQPLSAGDKTQELLSGVEMVDTVNSDTYKGYKLQVIVQGYAA